MFHQETATERLLFVACAPSITPEFTMTSSSSDTTTLGALDPHHKLNDTLRRIEVPTCLFDTSHYELLPTVDVETFEGNVAFANFGAGVVAIDQTTHFLYEIVTMPSSFGHRWLICKDPAMFVAIARRFQYWDRTKTGEWSEITDEIVRPDLISLFGEAILETVWLDLFDDMAMDSYDTIDPALTHGEDFGT
jgi:hypothetical protein